MKLDKQQQQVVTSKANKILVVAGAGSGKTRVLTERVNHLINSGVEAVNIVCITFTNMASQEMKERLSDVPTIGDAFIGTIHSFANTIYKTSGLTYQILTTEVSNEIYKELLMSTKYKALTYPKYLKYLDVQKLNEDGKLSDEVLNDFLLPSEQDALREVERGMRRLCKERHIISFSELLVETKAYYKKIGGSIEYLLVDEFQDVGNLEASFVESLNATNTFYVGDDWQSIYGFKGGNVSIFTNLIEDSDFKVYFLENNYRNSALIVDIAEKVISQVKSKIDKKVNVLTKTKGSVIVNNKGKIANYLQNMEKSSDKWGDWFILTRNNKELLEVGRLLEDRKIPYMSFKRAGMSYEQMQDIMKIDCVKLLTVHMSKGLENKNVCLYGNFPVKMPNWYRNEDERKVMYVGITRAKENLIILN